MEYLLHILIIFSIYAILAISLNLIVGYTGLLSITHAAFFGIGAYSSTLLVQKFEINFFAALFIGMLLSAILSLLIGIIASKFKGDYYALVTLGFNAIIFAILLNFQILTNGSLGIFNIAPPEIFGFVFNSNFSFLLLIAFFLYILYFFSKIITFSSFGRILRSIREDELATQILGYNTQYFKLVIFIIGCSFASIAGSFYASYISYIDPLSFSFSESLSILAMVIIGGLSSLRGSLLGAFALVILPEFLRFLGFPSEMAAQLRQLVYGMLIIILMIFRPQGLLGEYKL